MAAPPPSFRDVNVRAALADRTKPMEREGKLYVVRLDPPVLVQTPPVTLATSPFDSDGEPLSFVYLAPRGDLLAWMRNAEAAVLDACVARKKEWFRKALDDGAVRAGFKTFFRDGDKVKVRVPPDACVFAADRCTPVPAADALVAGATVHGVLELSRVCFGRTEFGAQWKLVQAAAPAPPPRCLITDCESTVDATAGGEDDDEFV